MSGKKNKRSLQDEMFIEIWRMLYKECFGFRPDLSEINLPSVKDNCVLPIIMLPQLVRGKVGFINRILGVCKESFCHYDDLDAVIAHNDRTPKNGSYAIRAGGHLEATDGDYELKNLSANVIRERGLLTLCLPERLIQELYVWHTMGIHLDKRDRTLCSGSRLSDGAVPGVAWDGVDGLCVGWYDLRDASPALRARSAVS